MQRPPRWYPSRMTRFVLLVVVACGGFCFGCDDGSGPPSDGGSVDGGDDSGGAGDAGDAGDEDAGDARDSGGDGGTVDGSIPGASAGCGIETALATGEWVAQTVDVDAVTRDYWVWVPVGYDPRRAYPVIYQFHGCSEVTSEARNNPPVEEHSGADAILVRGRSVADCWDTAADGTGVALFDALVAKVESALCGDLSRRFATGYSSGSFLTHRLGCVRGDMLRGVATIAGGQGGSSCVGTVAALLIHDDTDSIVALSASEAARDTHLARNGCDAAAPRTPTAFPPCEAYAGCDPATPVVWCQTTGLDHSRQDHLSAPAFWDFFSGF